MYSYVCPHVVDVEFAALESAVDSHVHPRTLSLLSPSWLAQYETERRFTESLITVLWFIIGMGGAEIKGRALCAAIVTSEREGWHTCQDHTSSATPHTPQFTEFRLCC